MQKKRAVQNRLFRYRFCEKKSAFWNNLLNRSKKALPDDTKNVQKQALFTTVTSAFIPSAFGKRFPLRFFRSKAVAL